MFRTRLARKLYKGIFAQNLKVNAQQRDWDQQVEGRVRKQSYQDVLAVVRSRGICGGSISERLRKDIRLPSRSFRHVPLISIRCGGGESDRLCSYLKKKVPYVSYAAPARILYIPELMPGVGGFPVSAKWANKLGPAWNLENIGAGAANEVTKGEGVKIGVIDTGVDYTHPELAGRFEAEKGYNFVDDTKDPYDGNGHGTHVAGITAGREVGVAPACTLYALKVLDDEGYGSEADVLAGIEWAIDHQLDAVNMSLGSSQYSYFEDMVVQEAYRRGVMVVAAAGNEYYGPSYPAALDHVVAVAAVNRFNEHAEFSNIYETNDISAPGVNILSCVPGGYQEFSGTSMATPHVTGSVALARSLKGWSPDELEKLLKKTAEPLGSESDHENESKYGAGLVRADGLVKEASSRGAYREVQEVRLG